MELATQVPRMTAEFADLDVHAIRRLAGQAESVGDENFLEFSIELVAVAVALADLGGAIRLTRKTVFRQNAGIGAEPHGPAQFVYPFQLAQFVDDTGRSCGIELG